MNVERARLAVIDELTGQVDAGAGDFGCIASAIKAQETGERQHSRQRWILAAVSNERDAVDRHRAGAPEIIGMGIVMGRADTRGGVGDTYGRNDASRNGIRISYAYTADGSGTLVLHDGVRLRVARGRWDALQGALEMEEL